MDIRQFMMKKHFWISDSRSVQNISDSRLRIEVQAAQNNGGERVKRFVNVHFHYIVSNSPVATGGYWELSPPKQSFNPPKLKHETLYIS